MRIIKNTQDLDTVCKYCKSILSVDKFDISYNYHFGHDSYFYYICPVCETYNKVHKENVPTTWNEHLEYIMAEAMGGDYD